MFVRFENLPFSHVSHLRNIIPIILLNPQQFFELLFPFFIAKKTGVKKKVTVFLLGGLGHFRILSMASKSWALSFMPIALTLSLMNAYF